jgi:hypothetical protein
MIWVVDFTLHSFMAALSQEQATREHTLHSRYHS